MFKIVEVKPLPDFRVWLKYEDGTEGEIDLSYLAGRGVFKKWDEPGEFEKVSIGSGGELCWGNDLDLCPDSLYMKLTRKTVEELFPGFGKAKVHA
jgi:hypothetical protein